MNVNISFLLSKTPCNLVHKYQRVRGIYCPNFQGKAVAFIQVMKVADNSGTLPLLPCRSKQKTTPKQLILLHQKVTITIRQNIDFYPENRGKTYVRNITICSEDEGCCFLVDGIYLPNYTASCLKR
jgi:hypothetical protein